LIKKFGMAFLRIWGVSGCIARARPRLVSSFLFILFEQSNADGRSDEDRMAQKDTSLPGEHRKTGLLAHRDGDDSDEKFCSCTY
jgi:hypothetical protein